MTTAEPPPQPVLARPAAATSANAQDRNEEEDRTGCRGSASPAAEGAAPVQVAAGLVLWRRSAAIPVLLVAVAHVVAVTVGAGPALRRHLDRHRRHRTEPLHPFLHQLEALGER